MLHTPLSVLVVDDDIDAADSVAALLEASGHVATAVYDGLEVLDVAGKLLPDVIILDVGLPGLNGYQVAALVRQERALDGTMLIALTGWDKEVHKRASRNAGIDFHLTKPVSAEALLSVLASSRTRA
jgi:CheY-like chemotaxis protein